MSASYASQVALALRLISTKGTTLTLTRPYDAQDAVNPVTDTPTSTDDKDYTVQAVILAVNGDKFAPDSGTKTKWRKLLIAASELTIWPQTGDRIRMLQADWTVHSCETLAPAGEEAVLHTVIVYR